MTQRQLASVLLAVVGLYLAAFRLPDAFLQGAMLARWDPAAADPSAPVPQRLTLALATTASGFTVVLGLALVILRDRIAARLFAETPGPLYAREFQAVALSVLGCYFVIQGVFNSMWFGALRWAGVVQAVLGLALFVGANALAGVWARVRATSSPQRPGESAV